MYFNRLELFGESLGKSCYNWPWRGWDGRGGFGVEGFAGYAPQSGREMDFWAAPSALKRLLALESQVFHFPPWSAASFSSQHLHCHGDRVCVPPSAGLSPGFYMSGLILSSQEPMKEMPFLSPITQDG